MYSYNLVGPNKLFLGTGCHAIHVCPDKVEFCNPVGHCGITITQIVLDFLSFLAYP